MPTPEPAALQLVKLWYPESAEEVVSWCAHIHMQSVLPEAIIIDDLDVFITQSKNPEHGAARLIAALVDAAAWIASKSERCKLIFTASHRVTVLPSVLRQFHFRIAELQKSSAGGENDFQLTLTHPSSSSKNVVTVDYTITGDNIMLRTVTSRSLPTDKTVVPAV
ncbi:hypothetical protein BaRGS_00015666 [Batillaria attramentaria]|uniref:ATPase AAA-type core domain-containing protein n=1 Tax=Batillaria attramentaria TaxID=370345 RepID=A0ABD0L115_9CAEN